MSDSKRVQNEGFVAFVRSQTFVPRDDLDMLFVAIDVPRGIVMKAWLVSSKTYASAFGEPNSRVGSAYKSVKQPHVVRWSHGEFRQVKRTLVLPGECSVTEGPARL